MTAEKEIAGSKDAMKKICNWFSPDDADLAQHIEKVLVSILHVTSNLPEEHRNRIKVEYSLFHLTHKIPNMPYFPAVFPVHAQFLHDCINELVNAKFITEPEGSPAIDYSNNAVYENFFRNYTDFLSEQRQKHPKPAKNIQKKQAELLEINKFMAEQVDVGPAFCYNISELNKLWDEGSFQDIIAAYPASTCPAAYTGYILQSGGNVIMTDYLGQKRKAELVLKFGGGNSPQGSLLNDMYKAEIDVTGFLASNFDKPTLILINSSSRRQLPDDFLKIIQKYRK